MGTKALIWFFNKSFRHLIRGLFVEQNSIFANVKQQLEAGNHVVLMPIYRSWADFFVLSYVQVLQGLEMPFTVGNSEDTPRIQLFDAWLK